MLTGVSIMLRLEDYIKGDYLEFLLNLLLSHQLVLNGL